MAIGRANCKCKECGKEFEMTAKRYNSGQAAEWAKWAEEHYTQCTDCYNKSRAVAQQEIGLILVIAPNRFEKAVEFVIKGDTYNRKDDIKALGGYRWDGGKGWVKMVSINAPDDLIATLDAVKALGVTISDKGQTEAWLREGAAMAKASQESK